MSKLSKETRAERRNKKKREKRANFKPPKLSYQDGAFMLESQAERDGMSDLPPDESPDAVALLDAQDHQCRWPLGEPFAMMFCGSQIIKGCHYCARHARLAYQPHYRFRAHPPAGNPQTTGA